MSKKTKTGKSSIWWGVVAIGALFVFGLSLWLGSLQSVWFDEAYTIDLIQRSYGDVIKYTALDAHPPLYYLLLKAWAGVFGYGEIALRSFSAAAGALAVLFAALLAKNLFGRRISLYALPFMVFAPFLIRYNFEIRMYALASLIGIAATYVLVRAVSGGTKKLWLIYLLLVAAGMYTLYFTSLLWFVHLVWLVMGWRKTSPRGKLVKEPWFMSLVGSIVVFGPWLPTFVDQIRNQVGSGVAHAVGHSDVAGLFSYGLLYEAPWRLNEWQSFAVVLAMVIAVWAVARAYMSSGSTDRQSLKLVGLYLLMPFAVLAVLSLPPLSPRYLDRYVSQMFIGGYLLVGVSFGLLMRTKFRKKAIVSSLVLFVMMIFGLVNLKTIGNFTFERTLEPRAKQITEGVVCSPDDIVMAGDALLYYELKYYLPDCDFRFYVTWGELSRRGGFAAVYGTPLQVRQGDTLEAPRVHYFYTDPEPLFELRGYRQESFEQILKYRHAVYVNDTGSGPDFDL